MSSPSSSPTSFAGPILSARDLVKTFPVTRGVLFRRRVGQVRAVDGVSFDLHAGETLGVVGESGCGKSTLAQLLMRLEPATSGSVTFEGEDVFAKRGAALTAWRRDMQIVLQDPYTSLNPRRTVADIVGEPFEIHPEVAPKGDRQRRVQELLERVGLDPEHDRRYPHQFSGGQRQRIGIARALALRPKVIVCDEPVSALDVSIQAQVMNLLEDLRDEFNIAFLFIAHDLAVVRHFCPDIAVMYLGKIVEKGPRETLYKKPHHPYTQALLSAVPDVSQAATGERRNRIRLVGDVPSPINPPSGCRFRTRCWKAADICTTTEPPLIQISPGHEVACHFAAPPTAADAIAAQQLVVESVEDPTLLEAVAADQPMAG